MEAAGSLEPHDGAADFEEHDVIRRVHDESDAANELIDRYGSILLSGYSCHLLCTSVCVKRPTYRISKAKSGVTKP